MTIREDDRMMRGEREGERKKRRNGERGREGERKKRGKEVHTEPLMRASARATC